MIPAHDDVVESRVVELMEELRIRLRGEPNVRGGTPQFCRHSVSDDRVSPALPAADLAEEKSQHLESPRRMSLRMVPYLPLRGRRHVDVKRNRRPHPNTQQILLPRAKPRVRFEPPAARRIHLWDSTPGLPDDLWSNHWHHRLSESAYRTRSSPR